MRRAYLIDTALGLASVFLALLTVAAKDWIEIVFGVDPDAGSGVLEWVIVAACFAAAVKFGAQARSGFRRRRVSPGDM
jgi:hypothetical protein